MQKCSFCSRWFKNKQAVRRHLGYCREYAQARGEGRAQKWRYVEMMGCTNCATDVTWEQAHDLYAASGCPSCSTTSWRRYWVKVPDEGDGAAGG